MLIFGNGEFAEIMRHYFGGQLTVHRKYMKGNELPFEDAEPQDLFIAIGPGRLNRNRQRIYEEAIARRFTVDSFVSPYAAMNGEHGHGVIVFEGNNIQPFSSIGDNTVLWSGNHIGHHTRIGNHCFITSHVCISGGCEIGDRTFIGVNAAITDHIKVGADCIVQAGSTVDRDVPYGSVWTREGLSRIPSEKIHL